MADIPLRTYVEEIDGLIEKKQVDEAIAHCKQILAYYPKHLGTYQALGKALLEKGRHTDAADIFQRVLSAVPDDFVAHIGMSIVREEESDLPGALWHMERAFEVMPSNTAIQEELRRLYGRRDGAMPPRTRLTRGALARLYTRSGLYAQAEAELKKALSETPDRLDLKAVLAEVFWRSNRYKEAADTCGDILQTLPYNQEANRMLADLLLAQGRTAEMVAYRQHLEALDPYAAFAAPDTDGHGSAAVKAESVMVPKLRYTADMAASDASTPSWVSSLGETLEQPKRAAVEEMLDWLPKPAAEAAAESGVVVATELPQWLKGAQQAVGADATRARAESAATMPLGPSPIPPPPAEADMPDWMKATVTTPLDMPDWMKAVAAPEEAPAQPGADEAADWLAAAAGPTQTVPDWMQGLPTAGQAAAPASAEPKAGPAAAFVMPSQPPAAGATAVEAGAAAQEVPDWIKQAAPVEAAPLAAEELPDWLRPAAPAGAETASAAATPAPAEPAAMSEEEALRWMESLALQQGAKPEELISQPAAAAQPTAPAAAEQPPAAQPAEGELPDWLKAAGVAVSAEELPDWLKEQAPAGPAAPAALAEAEKPDWLKQAEAESDAYEASLAQPAAPAAAAAPASPQATKPRLRAEELPDFLQMASPEAVAAAEQPTHLADEQAPQQPAAEPPLAAAELPDWLKEMATATGTSEAEPVTTPAEPIQWLESAPAAPEAAPAGEAATPISEEELPDWLRSATGEASAELPASSGAGAPPSWMQRPPPGVGDTAKLWLASQKIPEWLQQPAQEEQPAAPSPETVPPAQPTSEPPSPGGLPSWVQEAPPGPTDTVNLWLASRKVPDWLQSPEQPAAPPTPSAEPAAPSQPPAAPTAETTQPAEAAAKPLETGALPTWVQEPPPGASDTISLWLASQKIPEWLQRPGAASEPAAPVPPAPEPAAAAPQPPTAPAPARPPIEDLVTKNLSAPAAPLAVQTPPVAWAQPQAAPAAPAQATPPAQPPAPTGVTADFITQPLAELPAWLTLEEPAAAPQSQAAPAAPVAELEAAPAAPAAEVPAVPETPATPVAPEVAAGPSVSTAEVVAATVALAAAVAPAAAVGPVPEAAAAPAAPIAEFMAAPEIAAAPTMPPAEVMAAPEAIAAPAAPIAGVPAPAPSLEALNEDEALRWLESLAAQQGAKPEELITRPEERLAQPPAWVAAETEAAAKPPAPPGLEEQFKTEPLAELPEWLTVEKPAEVTPAPAVETPPPAAVPPAEVMVSPEAAAAPAAPIAGVPAPAPSLEALNEDEALRWLESLAAQQGAKPEELITRPEERLAQPPAWVAAETEAAAKPPAPPGLEEQFKTEPLAELPEWLTVEKPAEVTPAPAVETPPPAAVPPAEVMAAPEAPAALAVPVAQGPTPPLSLEAVNEEEALRWLESLAAQQGAKPEELVTRPEERLAQPPAWVTAETEAAGAEEETVEPELPKLSFTVVPPPEPALLETLQPPAEAAEAPRERDERLSKLAEKLASTRRAKEADIEARFEAQRAEQEAARLAVQQKLERKPAEPEVRPAGLQPAAPVPPPAPAAPPVPATPLPAVKAAAPAAARPASAPKPRAPAAPRPKVPAAPRARRARLSKSPYAAHEPADVLAQAHQHLDAKNLDGAAEALAYLVGSGNLVHETIAELEGFSAQQRSAPLLQVLGDAYMKNNQLQKALDAYRQALGRL